MNTEDPATAVVVVLAGSLLGALLSALTVSGVKRIWREWRRERDEKARRDLQCR